MLTLTHKGLSAAFRSTRTSSGLLTLEDAAAEEEGADEDAGEEETTAEETTAEETGIEEVEEDAVETAGILLEVTATQ